MPATFFHSVPVLLPAFQCFGANLPGNRKSKNPHDHPMILTDKKILEAIERREIVIEPFRRECLGTNSYDVHLGKYLGLYRNRVLDAKQHNQIDIFEISGDEGFVLQPGTE